MPGPEKSQHLAMPPKAVALAKLRAQWQANVIGRKMPDGTIFAGSLPDGRKVFAMPEDAGVTMNFNLAAVHAAKLNNNKAHGHEDWRIPTREELDLLIRNKDKGSLKDTFNERWDDAETDGDYWSSTPMPSGYPFGKIMYAQRPSDGSVGQVHVDCKAAVRCVR